jgi:hypothetical protein
MQSFMRKTSCECGCVLAGFAGVAQSLNVDDRAGSVYVTNEYVHDRVIKVPVRVAANAKCGQWWQAMTDAGWLRKDIVKGDAESCGVNPVVTLRRSIRKIRDYRQAQRLIRLVPDQSLLDQKNTLVSKRLLANKDATELVPTDLLEP